MTSTTNNQTVLSVSELEEKARWLRLEVLEKTVAAGRGHLGGTYSCVELLTALYYGGVMRIDTADAKWDDRDRLLIGKGHACLAVYAMFNDLGMMSNERYATYGEDGGLGGQLDLSIPGVEINTGSLGHVLGVGAGMAMAAQMDGSPARAFALMGDAETHEGSVWEAMAFAGEQKLDGLVGIIDRNRLSVTHRVDDDSMFNEFQSKVETFGWQYEEIDGHSFAEILGAFKSADTSDKPVMIVANTVKGKGVSFMENGIEWHQAVPNEDQLEIARVELRGDAG